VTVRNDRTRTYRHSAYSQRESGESPYITTTTHEKETRVSCAELSPPTRPTNSQHSQLGMASNRNVDSELWASEFAAGSEEAQVISSLFAEHTRVSQLKYVNRILEARARAKHLNRALNTPPQALKSSPGQFSFSPFSGSIVSDHRMTVLYASMDGDVEAVDTTLSSQRASLMDACNRSLVRKRSRRYQKESSGTTARGTNGADLVPGDAFRPTRRSPEKEQEHHVLPSHQECALASQEAIAEGKEIRQTFTMSDSIMAPKSFISELGSSESQTASSGDTSSQSDESSSHPFLTWIYGE